MNFEIATPYMLRNDGQIFTCGDRHPYLAYAAEISMRLEELYKKGNPFKVLSIAWLKKHSSSDELRDLLTTLDYAFDLAVLTRANFLANQEFLRLRMSGLLFGGTSHDLYARVSSVGFDWLPVLQKALRDSTNVSSITLVTDANTFGGSFDTICVKGVEVSHLPLASFLAL